MSVELDEIMDEVTRRRPHATVGPLNRKDLDTILEVLLEYVHNKYAPMDLCPSVDEQRSHLEAHREIEVRLATLQPRPEAGYRVVVEREDEG